MASDSSDSDGSDINITSALPETTDKKTSNSLTNDLLENTEDLKLKTKEMIMQAFMDLHSKKGVSLFAVKKYIADRYNVDTKKLKLFIKKSIKSALQEGIIIQTKGIRVSGSFKLASVEEEVPKTKKPKKEKTEKAKRNKDPERKKKLKKKTVKIEEKTTEVKDTPENPEGESLTSATAVKENEEDKPVEPKKKKIDTEKKPKEKVPKEKKPRQRKPKEKKPKVKKERVKKVRIPAHLKKPKKITKRRNGVSSSILKPPKMKPQPEI